MATGRGADSPASPLRRGARVSELQMDLYERFRRHPKEAIETIDDYLRSTERGGIEGPGPSGEYTITDKDRTPFTGGLEEAGKWCSVRMIECWDVAWWMLDNASAGHGREGGCP